MVVDHVGNITHSASFDAWGQRRSSEDWESVVTAASFKLPGFDQPITQRGFTGHEVLDDVGLIHMNGRIFDPHLARFMQADSYIQAATHSQSYNRYSYTFNNPLNATDPSGYIAWGPILKATAWIAGSYAAADYGRRNNIPWLGQVASIAGCMYGYCAAASFGSTYGATQNLGIAMIAGISAGALSGMGPSARFLMSGMLGGTSSVMMGGKFGHGFISAGLGSLAGMAGGDKFDTGGLITSAVVGGTISEMTGGKFANGAQSAAFAYAMQWGAQKYGAGGEILQDSSVPGGSAPNESYVGETVYNDAMAEAQRQVAGGEVLNTSSFEYKDQYVVAQAEGTMLSDGGGRKVFAADEWYKVKAFFNSKQSKDWGIVNGEYDSATKKVVLYRSSTHSEQGYIPKSTQPYSYTPMEKALGTIFHEGYHVRFPNAPNGGHPSANWAGDNAVYRYRQYLKSSGN